MKVRPILGLAPSISNQPAVTSRIRGFIGRSESVTERPVLRAPATA